MLCLFPFLFSSSHFFSTLVLCESLYLMIFFYTLISKFLLQWVNDDGKDEELSSSLENKFQIQYEDIQLTETYDPIDGLVESSSQTRRFRWLDKIWVNNLVFDLSFSYVCCIKHERVYICVVETWAETYITNTFTKNL